MGWLLCVCSLALISEASPDESTLQLKLLSCSEETKLGSSAKLGPPSSRPSVQIKLSSSESSRKTQRLEFFQLSSAKTNWAPKHKRRTKHGDKDASHKRHLGFHLALRGLTLGTGGSQGTQIAPQERTSQWADHCGTESLRRTMFQQLQHSLSLGPTTRSQIPGDNFPPRESG